MASPAIEKARAMRKALSPPEARLWAQLKKLRSEGYMIRRQYPVAGYFMDFACISKRLCIEVDGAHHGFPDQIRHDRRRDAVLAAEGYLTIRLDPKAIRDDVAAVVEQIRAALDERP